MVFFIEIEPIQNTNCIFKDLEAFKSLKTI